MQNNVAAETTMVEAACAMAHCPAELRIGEPVRLLAVRQAARELLEDYLDMTPQRIFACRRREELGRVEGEEIYIAFGTGRYA